MRLYKISIRSFNTHSFTFTCTKRHSHIDTAIRTRLNNFFYRQTAFLHTCKYANYKRRFLEHALHNTQVLRPRAGASTSWWGRRPASPAASSPPPAHSPATPTPPTATSRVAASSTRRPSQSLCSRMFSPKIGGKETV